MACYHPLRGWRTRSGAIALGREPPDSESVDVPCGGCTGCRKAKAKAWALRCHFEAQDHKSALFTTLTYNDDALPPTLQPTHLTGFIKRIRQTLHRSDPARRIRFFACGEYGEQFERPHYHAILYGCNENDRLAIQKNWPHGTAHTVRATTRSIAYVAGYAAKKYTQGTRVPEERVDMETGEVYTWIPPFLRMSRNPGIGANVKKHAKSWRDVAILKGKPQAVPRFLHEAWRAQATTEEIEQLANDRHELMKIYRMTKTQRAAKEQYAKAQQAQSAAKRHYG